MAVDRPSLSCHWAFGILFVLFAGLVARPTPAQPADPGPPTRLEVDPNAIEDPARPMGIEIGGIPPGQRAYLKVLQDCDGNPGPDLQGAGECISPLFERESVKADGELTVHDRLSFLNVDQVLQKAGKGLLPRKKSLWLFASRQGSNQGRLVLFKLVEKNDVCSIWQTAIDVFGGRCDPGLLQAMRRHRGIQSARLEPLFEVRRVDVRGDAVQADPVARTRGATGVAWDGTDALLVTVGNAMARAEAENAEARPEARPLSAGLWRISLLPGREPQILWEQPPGEIREAVAPLLLPGGRIAFARQSPGDEAVVGEEPAAFLSVWQDGKLDPARDVPLPYKIHQLLASDARGELILALSLGVGANRPTFLQIDLSRGTFEYLGFHPALYHAALRSPGGEDSVVAFEDNSGQQGWDLVLVDGKGELLKDLQTRKEDDLLPAWQPDGREIAFLAELEKKEKPR